MPLVILGSIDAAAREPVLKFGNDSCAASFCPLEVLVNVFNVDP